MRRPSLSPAPLFAGGLLVLVGLAWIGDTGIGGRGGVRPVELLSGGHLSMTDKAGVPTLRLGGAAVNGAAAAAEGKVREVEGLKRLESSLTDIIARVARGRRREAAANGRQQQRQGSLAALAGRAVGQQSLAATPSPGKNARAPKLMSAQDAWAVPGAVPSADLAQAKQIWERFADSFREQHPGMGARQEQREVTEAWKTAHPEIYYARFPEKPRPGAPGAPAPAPAGRQPGVERGFIAPAVGYRHHPGAPPTVLGPPDDGVRDFDGRSAVKAHLPDLGWAQPSVLTEYGLEVRGTFVVRVQDSAGQPELLVERARSGEDTPFQCTYRGYRRLGGDFAGNTVYTGFKRVWHGSGGKLFSGMSIGPSGNPSEFDVMTCRDLDTGEVQYFRLQPERVLANMKERYCAGEKPIGPYDISCI